MSEKYSKPRISRIQVDRQIYPRYAKIRLMRSEIKGFGTIVPEILSEICEDPTYARFTVYETCKEYVKRQRDMLRDITHHCKVPLLIQEA